MPYAKLKFSPHDVFSARCFSSLTKDFLYPGQNVMSGSLGSGSASIDMEVEVPPAEYFEKLSQAFFIHENF